MKSWLPVTSAQFCVFDHRVNKILKLQRISPNQIIFLISARRTAAESDLCKVHSRGRRAIVKSCFLSLFTPRLVRYLSDLIRCPHSSDSSCPSVVLIFPSAGDEYTSTRGRCVRPLGTSLSLRDQADLFLVVLKWRKKMAFGVWEQRCHRCCQRGADYRSYLGFSNVTASVSTVYSEIVLLERNDFYVYVTLKLEMFVAF